jgi:hypothetical protein
LEPLGNVVLFEVPIPGGRIDLVVNNGIYEIKPLGGTVSPLPQLNRYLGALFGMYMAGTYPFDDFVNPELLPLPPWVLLHYELTDPGVIEYDFQFNYGVLLPILVFALVRVAQLAYVAISELDLGLVGVEASFGFAF